MLGACSKQNPPPPVKTAPVPVSSPPPWSVSGTGSGTRFYATSLEEFHAGKVSQFVFSPDFGNERTGWINESGVTLKPKASDPSDKLPVAYEPTQFNLVSLLKHAPPVAYARRPPLDTDKHNNTTASSARRDANLPENDEIRALDAFEKAALPRLQSGETLVAEPAENGTLRMLGALRASESCINCHEGASVGSLLGAFSYVLTPVPGKTAEKP